MNTLLLVIHRHTGYYPHAHNLSQGQQISRGHKPAGMASTSCTYCATCIMDGSPATDLIRNRPNTDHCTSQQTTDTKPQAPPTVGNTWLHDRSRLQNWGLPCMHHFLMCSQVGHCYYLTKPASLRAPSLTHCRCQMPHACLPPAPELPPEAVLGALAAVDRPSSDMPGRCRTNALATGPACPAAVLRCSNDSSRR